MDKIERDVYVCRGTVPEPIEYPQGTNAIPLIFYMRDFTMPENATVAFYMMKPSGAVIFDAGTYEDDTIIIPMTTQMSAEAGRMQATVHILQDSTVLNSFNIPVFVKKVAYDPDAVESTDELTALDYLLTHMDDIIAQLKVLYQEASDEVKAAYEQFLIVIQRHEDEYREEFEEWFENLQYVLDGDVAGHLQNEIETAQDTADEALEQLATGWVTGFLTDGDGNALQADDTVDDEAITISRPICNCGRMIADSFMASRSYAVGDYCIYDNTLYRFINAKSPGEWDPDKVVATTIAAELASAYSSSTASISTLRAEIEETEEVIQTMQSTVASQSLLIREMREEIEELNLEMNNKLDFGNTGPEEENPDDEDPDDENPDPEDEDPNDENPDDENPEDEDPDTDDKEAPGIIIPDD